MSNLDVPKSETLTISHIDQITTKGDGTLEKGEWFTKAYINFDRVLQHVKIHQEGEVAGSQFNNKVFKSGEDLIDDMMRYLPETMNYDQFGRAEFTLTFRNDSPPTGWSGVKSLDELKSIDPDLVVESKPRMPGGEAAVVDGIEGAWYPESEFKPGEGMVPILDEHGAVKNPHGKFEPNAQIALVDPREIEKSMRTNKVTLIIQKDTKTNTPVAVTIFPGENAPAFPAKFNAEGNTSSTLSDSNESRFWNNHVLVQKGALKPAPDNSADISALSDRRLSDQQKSNIALEQVRNSLENTPKELPLWLEEKDGKFITTFNEDEDVTADYSEFLAKFGKKPGEVTLPEFLYENNGIILTSNLERTDITESWKKWVDELEK